MTSILIAKNNHNDLLLQKNRRSTDASDFRPNFVNPTPPVAMPAQVASDPLPMVTDSTPLPVSSPGQVISDPMVVDLTPLPASSPAH
jgi:hypothetical protein